MNKTQYIIAAVALLTAFAVGRFTTPTKIEIQTKTVTVEVEKKDVKTKQDAATTITETVNPNGSKVTVTRIDTHTDTETKTTDATSTVASASKVVERTEGPTLQALAGVDVTNPTKGFVFGATISKPLIGPIVIGLWGLQTGTAGLSVGLKF